MVQRSDVVTAVAQALRGSDFAKRTGGIFTRALDKDVLGWLGLNMASRRGDGVLEVNPVVGVRHQIIEQTVAELHGEKAKPYVPPTVSQSLGYVMPDGSYRPWLIGTPAELDDHAASIAAAVQSYGLQFMHDHASLEGMIDGLRGHLGASPEQRAERIAVAFWLLGDQAATSAALDALSASLDGRTDMAADRSRAFVRAFAAQAEPSAP